MKKIFYSIFMISALLFTSCYTPAIGKSYRLSSKKVYFLSFDDCDRGTVR